MKRITDVDKFLKRLFPSASPPDMESSRARILERLHAQMPERVEAFRFWPIATTIRPFDVLVMTAVSLLGDAASSATICAKMEELTAKAPRWAKVCVALARMCDQALVTREERQDENRKRYLYTLTEEGRYVLSIAPGAHEATEKLGDFA